jgi:hypothetical protein
MNKRSGSVISGRLNVCDKQYLLLLMFVDYAVEPYYYERGVNFYEDGQKNYALASLLYYAGPTVLGQVAFDDLLAAFQRAVKEKTPEAIKHLVAAARRKKADQNMTKPWLKETNSDQIGAIPKKNHLSKINYLDGRIGGGGGSRTRVRRRLTPGTTCLAHC